MPSPLVWLGVAALAIVLADYAPALINGLLVLILAGLVLNHSDTWAPWLQSLGAREGPATPVKG